VRGPVDAVNAGRLEPPVVVVLEGAARQGVEQRDEEGLRVVHAPRSGDDTIAEVATDAMVEGYAVMVVTDDRELQGRVRQVGCDVVGPRWLLDRM
jgi:rRNA-processing protein FCF1